MKRKNGNGYYDSDAYYADQLLLAASEKKSKRARVTESEYFERGNVVHKYVTVVQKRVPSVGVILLAAIVFMLVGAMVCAAITAVDFAKDGPIKEAFSQVMGVTPAPAATSGSNSGTTGADIASGGSLGEIYKQNVEGVVVIKSYSSKQMTSSSLESVGTGFFITSDGYIITNAHVVDEARAVEIVMYSGERCEAKLVGKDVSTDIAVLKVDVEGAVVSVIGDSDTVCPGEFVLAIGHPTGEELKFTATFGMVGAIERSVNIDGVTNTYIQIDAAINPGNSGGPLFDMNGRIIGVNSAKTVVASYNENGEKINAEGLGFALPINRAMEVAKTLMSEGEIQRPGIGISVITIDAETAAKYGVPQGVLVYSVIKDGPGDIAGLYADDIIISADGVEVKTIDEFLEIVKSKKVGERIEIRYVRNDGVWTALLEIGDLNKIGKEILDNAFGGKKFGIGE